MSEAGWTFLSNYGHVMVYLSGDPGATMREIADGVGITERAVQQIVRDLVDGGYLEKHKQGRRNSYRIVGSARFRHPLEQGVTVGAFLDLVVEIIRRSDARGCHVLPRGWLAERTFGWMVRWRRPVCAASPLDEFLNGHRRE